MSRAGKGASIASLLLDQMEPPRWTSRMFRAACRAGCFEDMKVELVQGRLVLMTEGPEHANCVTNTEEALEPMLPKAVWYISRERSVRFPRWILLPDVAVCRGERKLTYGDRLPAAWVVTLLVEVCHTTYRYDRKVKYPRYAAAGVPVYWIVDIDRRVVAVYASSSQRAYKDTAIYKETQDVLVVIDGNEVGKIGVQEILP
jgi:Uma2 family endonuclease